MKHIAKHITLLGLFVLISCSPENTEMAEEVVDQKSGITITESAFNKMGLELGNLQSIEISELIKASGIVDVPPESIAEISYPVSGFIKTLGHNILEGKYVKKGSPLATIQSMELIQLQQDYLEHYNEHTFLAQDLERQKTMNDENAGTKKALQEAENKYKVNQSMIATYEAKLQLLNISTVKLQKGELVNAVAIRAPFSGFIQKVNIHTGTNFTPQVVLFEMISKDHLHVELKVFEKDAFKLKKGQKVTFNGTGLQEKVAGEVFLVGQAFEGDSKAINVHVHIPDNKTEQQLMPGQYLNGSVFVDSRTVAALPESALLREEGKVYTYETSAETSGEYTFIKKLVTIGTIQDGMAEIMSPNDLQNVLIKKVTFLTGGFGEE